MKKNKRIILIIILTIVLIQDCLILFSCLNSFKQNAPNLKIKTSNHNKVKELKLNINETNPFIDPKIFNYLQNNSSPKNVEILVEIKQEQFSFALDYFKNLCNESKIKILNSTYYKGISVIITKKTLKYIIEKLPLFIKKIKIPESSSPTMRYANRQLRIFPYIRKNYKLKGDGNTSIAILDSGVDGSHTAFKNKIVFWKDFFGTYNTPKDFIGHGTAVASVASGNPWNTTDNKGRTIISEREFYSWPASSQLFPNLSKTYKYVTHSFKVDCNGNITIYGNWFAESGSSVTIISFRLVNESGIAVKEVKTPNKNDFYQLDYEINSLNYGIYSFEYTFNVSVLSNIEYGINVTIYFPENITDLDDLYSGVAPNCKIVALRCVSGSSDEDEIISALNWVLNHKKEYNITAVVMSFKINSDTIRNLANKLVEAGIVVSCAAGNDGGGANYAGSRENAPGSATKVISVGAINQNSSLTVYSSQGGYDPTHSVIKPDVLAPGGVINDYTYKNLPIICTESNNNEYLGPYTPTIYQNMTDVITNDSIAMSGTSFSAPIVAGVSQLIINALGGRSNWNYTEQEALFVKNLILLTATESYPNKRLLDPSNSPTLNRGGKDIQEGYGKINPDAALDALLQQPLSINSTISGYLYSIPYNNESKPYCWARQIYLPRNFYNITLEVPKNADFDLYIYKYYGNSYGEPIIVKKATTAKFGGNESLIDFAPPKDGKYFVVIKGVNGSGQFNLSFYKSPTYFDKIPPKCKIIYPLNNSFLNESVLIRVWANDSYSGIRNITVVITSPKRQVLFNFYNPNTTISFFWKSQKIDNGICSIYAIAYDGFNNSAISNYSYIIIFNDDIPPVINWISPEDKATIIGKILIEAKIVDQHSKLKNATIYIETTNNSYIINVEIKNGLVQYVWIPRLEDDGTCFIKIGAYDNNYNEGFSETIVVFLRNRMFLYNTLLSVAIITIIAMSFMNKYVKKLLASEAIISYLQDIAEFMRKPRKIELNRINPLNLLNLSTFIKLKIDEMSNYIKCHNYNKALQICNQLLNIKFPIARRQMSKNLVRVLEDIRNEIMKNIN